MKGSERDEDAVGRELLSKSKSSSSLSSSLSESGTCTRTRTCTAWQANSGSGTRTEKGLPEKEGNFRPGGGCDYDDDHDNGFVHVHVPVHGRRGGFTLLEVLVAIGLFGFAAVTLAAAFANALLALGTMHDEAELEADLRWIRREVMLEASRETFEAGGDITTLRHGRARWMAVVEQTGVMDLFVVTLDVRLETAEGSVHERQDVLHVLRPSWSDPRERAQLLEENRHRIELERPLTW